MSGQLLTDEQDKKVQALYDQWIAEAKLIQDSELPPKAGFSVLDGKPSDPYHELSEKYRRKIREITQAQQSGDANG